MFRQNHCYQEFDGLAHRIAHGPTAAAAKLRGYKREAVAKRLLQRVVEVTFRAYSIQSAGRHEQGLVAPLTQTESIECAGLRIETASGRVVPGFGALARAVGEFLFHWLHVLSIYSRAAFRRSNAQGSATLLFGVGMGDLNGGGSDARFANFCHRGPITPLVRTQRVIVQAAGELVSTEPDYLRYARFPLHALAEENPLRLLGLLRFLMRHLSTLGIYVGGIWRCRAIALLGRDVAYHAMVSDLSERRLIEAVLITNSNYTAQPLWMMDLPERTFRTHMVWYSTNFLPVMWKDDAGQAFIPPSRHMRADEMWVWSNWHAGVLKGLGVTSVMRVAGPILWYLPEPALFNRRDELCVVVFDVTPLKPEQSARLGQFDTYYCAENMIRFVEDVVYACAEMERTSGRKVRIVFKHKRGHKSVHDPRYIGLVEKLTGPSRTVELVPPDSNMYSLIACSDLTVVVPYSSPAYVASQLGCPAIYYDPTQEVEPAYDKQSLLTFVAGRQQLIEQMTKTVNSLAGVM